MKTRSIGLCRVLERGGVTASLPPVLPSSSSFFFLELLSISIHSTQVRGKTECGGTWPGELFPGNSTPLLPPLHCYLPQAPIFPINSYRRLKRVSAHGSRRRRRRPSGRSASRRPSPWAAGGAMPAPRRRSSRPRRRSSRDPRRSRS